MSIENNEKIYQQNVLNIFKKKVGVREDKQLAEIIGIIPEELANRKRRGTLVQTLFIEAIKRKLDLNEIFYPEKSRPLENSFLKKIEEWLGAICKKEKGREVWFEYHFRDSFTDFAKWEEEKKHLEGEGNHFPSSKVA